jgi:hypothetical protein
LVGTKDEGAGNRKAARQAALSMAFRHTFAVGHSSLEMTRRYANLLTDDLQAVHQRCSLLAG